MSQASARHIMRQLQDIQQNPIDGITLKPTDEIQEVHAVIDGPADTPFAGGVFTVTLVLGDNYPTAPPRGYFRTKVFHPNVSEKGEICVNTLKRDWSPDLGLRHVLTVVRCLLVEPNAESALNEEAGRLLLEDYNEYFKRAKMHTSVHARGAHTPPPAPAFVSFSQSVATSSSASARNSETASASASASSNSGGGGNPASSSGTTTNSSSSTTTITNGGGGGSTANVSAGSLRNVDNTNSIGATAGGNAAGGNAEGGAEKKAVNKKRAMLKRL